MRRILRRLESGLENHEFVAAETGDDVVLANGGGQTRGDLAQEFVADRVAERVVDRLEAIEIEKQDRDLSAARDRDQRLANLVEQRGAIDEAGEGVVMGEEFDSLLGPTPLRDVLVGGHPAPVGPRLLADRDGPAVRHFDHIALGQAGARDRLDRLAMLLAGVILDRDRFEGGGDDLRQRGAEFGLFGREPVDSRDSAHWRRRAGGHRRRSTDPWAMLESATSRRLVRRRDLLVL